MSTLRVERVMQCPFSTTMHRIAEYIDANHGVLPLTLPARAFGIPSLFAVRRDAVVRFLVTRDATSTQKTLEAIAISWSPEEGGRLPAFTGLITARPHSNGVLVTLDGRYTPPFHWLGAIFDRAVGHRAAVACCEALLADMQRSLEIVAIAFGLRIGSSPCVRSAFMLEGIVGTLCAILILTRGANALLFIVAIWAGVTGLLEIAAALALPSASWIIATLGVASLGFGVALFAWPTIAVRTFVDLMTSYTILAAILFLSAALTLRRVHLRRIPA